MIRFPVPASAFQWKNRFFNESIGFACFLGRLLMCYNNIDNIESGILGGARRVMRKGNSENPIDVCMLRNPLESSIYAKRFFLESLGDQAKPEACESQS